MELKQYHYVKEEIASITWELPTEPQYFFETHIRRSISIVPEWTTWNMEYNQKPEEIFQFKVICVYLSFEAKIDAFIIPVSRLEDLYYREKEQHGDIVKGLINNDFHKRTKEQFMADFNSCLEKIKEKL